MNPDNELDGADSVERFAERYDISRAQVFKELASGRLVGRKVGSRTIINREDGLRWARSLPETSARQFNGPGRDVALPAERLRPKRISPPPRSFLARDGCAKTSPTGHNNKNESPPLRETEA
jgi:hypothetical protein